MEAFGAQPQRHGRPLRSGLLPQRRPAGERRATPLLPSMPACALVAFCAPDQTPRTELLRLPSHCLCATCAHACDPNNEMRPYSQQGTTASHENGNKQCGMKGRRGCKHTRRGPHGPGACSCSAGIRRTVSSWDLGASRNTVAPCRVGRPQLRHAGATACGRQPACCALPMHASTPCAPCPGGRTPTRTVAPLLRTMHARSTGAVPPPHQPHLVVGLTGEKTHADGGNDQQRDHEGGHITQHIELVALLQRPISVRGWGEWNEGTSSTEPTSGGR